ncbi:hypothetical protein ACOSP7_007477 [Xanthoceras sorbifolium]
MKTFSDHIQMDFLRVCMGYIGKLVVNRVGKSEGMCLFWTYRVDVSLITYSRFHIDIKSNQVDMEASLVAIKLFLPAFLNASLDRPFVSAEVDKMVALVDEVVAVADEMATMVVLADDAVVEAAEEQL